MFLDLAGWRAWTVHSFMTLYQPIVIISDEDIVSVENEAFCTIDEKLVRPGAMSELRCKETPLKDWDIGGFIMVGYNVYMLSAYIC